MRAAAGGIGPSEPKRQGCPGGSRRSRRQARWLTRRTWAKGARVVEVMEAAQLSLAESPRYTSQLWRQLVKDQRTWLTKSLVEVIDGEYPRDLWSWFKGLDLTRAIHAPRT